MSLHSSHTDAGITPSRINTEKILQPRHSAKAASRNAANASPAITIRAAVTASCTKRTLATIDIAAPMP